jgi:hypothetical protein
MAAVFVVCRGITGVPCRKSSVSLQHTLQSIEDKQEAMLGEKTQKRPCLLVAGTQDRRSRSSRAEVVKRGLKKGAERRLGFVEAPPEDTSRSCTGCDTAGNTGFVLVVSLTWDTQAQNVALSPYPSYR